MKTRTLRIFAFTAIAILGFGFFDPAYSQPAGQNMANFPNAGSNNYVSIPNSTSLSPTTAITIEAWINLTSWTLGGAIVCKGTGAGGEVYSLDIYTDNKPRFYFWKVIGGVNTTFQVNNNIAITAGTWYHLAGVYDGTNLYIYVNGVPGAAVPGPSPAGLPTNTHIVSIGSRQANNLGGSYDLYVQGKIDEVRIWNTARTQAQIRSDMYRELLTPYSSNLKAYYRFNGSSGQYNDLTTNGNNGSIVGTVQNVASTAPIPFYTIAAGSWATAGIWASGQGVPPSTNYTDVWINHNVTVNAAKTIRNVTIAANTLSDNGFQITSAGTLNLTGGTFKLGVAGTATIFPNFGAGINISAGTTVEYAAGVAQTVSAAPTYANLTFSGASTKTAGGVITVNGAFTSSAGTFSTVYNINFNGTTTCGATMNATAGTVTYATTAVNILAGTYSGLTINGSPVTFCGAVTVNGTFAPSGTINISNDFTISGSVTCGGTMNATAGTVEYAAISGSQNIIAGTYNNLKQDNTSGTNTACGNLTVNGLLTTTPGGTLDMVSYSLSGGGGFASSNGGTIKTQSTIPEGKTWTGTIEYYGGVNQTVAGGTYLYCSTMTAGTYSAGGSITVSNGGLFDNGGGSNQAAVLDMGSSYTFTKIGTGAMGNNYATIRFGGATNGIAVASIEGTVEYYGPVASQIIGSGTYGKLKLNNSNGASLTGNVTVDNTLILTDGKLTTGSNTLIVSNTATAAISGASSSTYVIGNLQRAIATGTNTYDYPVGTSGYTPASLAFSSVSGGGNITVTSTDGVSSNYPAALSSTKKLARYWTITNGGIGTFTAAATCTYLSGDLIGGAAQENLVAYKFDAPSDTTYPSTTTGTLSFTASGITSLSELGAGECGTISATISGDTTICAGGNATLKVVLTGTPKWSYTWSDGTNTGTVSNVTTSPSTFVVSTASTKTYTITNVSDTTGCSSTGTGSVKVSIGPVTIAPVMYGCAGNLIEIPVKVTDFTYIGAISLTLNYNKSVIKFSSYEADTNLIDYCQADTSGANGVVRFSGTPDPPANLDDNDTLIILKFNYTGGYTALTWDDSDDVWCEYGSGPPNYIPYCDNPTNIYYINGSVSDASLVADFTADKLFPPIDTIVTLTDLSTGGATSWEWSFDRPTVVYDNGTNSNSQNPQVHFTDGGLYTITLTVYNASCTDTEVKTGYIRAGTPGLWDGPTSTDWYTGTNWDNHLVPTTPIDVLIPTRPADHFYPHVLGNLTTGTDCNNITLTGNAELRVDGLFTVSPGTTLKIKDNAKVYAGN